MFFFPAWSMKLNGLGTVFTGIITELLLMRVFFFKLILSGKIQCMDVQFLVKWVELPKKL